MPDYRKTGGRDTTENLLLRMDRLEERMRRMSGGHRVGFDRGDTASIAAPVEGQTLIQYDTEAPYYYSNGAWHTFGGSATAYSWTEWTTNFATGGSTEPTLTTDYAKYVVIGTGIVHARMYLVINDPGSGGNYTVDTPGNFDAAITAEGPCVCGTGFLQQAAFGTVPYPIWLFAGGSTSTALEFKVSVAGSDLLTPTNPVTMAAGDYLTAFLTFRAGAEF